MKSRPNRQDGEDVLQHVFQVLEWERIAKAEAVKDCAAIDRIRERVRRASKAPVKTTGKTEIERLSLHDAALTNPLLRSILRDRS